jgi:L-lysine 2,3-aminomutase
VNDDLETLVALSERLIAVRAMPYYLHQLDQVRGAAHFDVSIPHGLKLIEGLQARLPGYAVPRYVCEQAGAENKIPLMADPFAATIG